MPNNIEHKFIDFVNFLEKLGDSKIYYEIKHTRYDSIEVAVVIPGEYWEIEFMVDGSIEIEIFKSDGEIFDRDKLKELFERFGEKRNKHS